MGRHFYKQVVVSRTLFCLFWVRSKNDCESLFTGSLRLEISFEDLLGIAGFNMFYIVLAVSDGSIQFVCNDFPKRGFSKQIPTNPQAMWPGAVAWKSSSAYFICEALELGIEPKLTQQCPDPTLAATHPYSQSSRQGMLRLETGSCVSLLGD